MPTSSMLSPADFIVPWIMLFLMDVLASVICCMYNIRPIRNRISTFFATCVVNLLGVIKHSKFKRKNVKKPHPFSRQLLALRGFSLCITTLFLIIDDFCTFGFMLELITNHGICVVFIAGGIIWLVSELLASLICATVLRRFRKK